MHTGDDVSPHPSVPCQSLGGASAARALSPTSTFYGSAPGYFRTSSFPLEIQRTGVLVIELPSFFKSDLCNSILHAAANGLSNHSSHVVSDETAIAFQLLRCCGSPYHIGCLEGRGDEVAEQQRSQPHNVYGDISGCLWDTPLQRNLKRD